MTTKSASAPAQDEVLRSASEAAERTKLASQVDVRSILEKFTVRSKNPVGHFGMNAKDKQAWESSTSKAERLLASKTLVPSELTLRYPEEVGRFENKGLSKAKQREAGFLSSEEWMNRGKGVKFSPLKKPDTKWLFEALHAAFLSKITVALEKMDPVTPVKFDPNVPYPHAGTMRLRVERCGLIGEIANQLECQVGSVGPLWGRILAEVRELYPDEAHLLQEKAMAGRIFPYAYVFAPTNYMRYNGWPNHTVRDAKRVHSAFMLSRLSRLSGLTLYDIDLSACHMRAVTLCVGERRSPYLDRALNDKDLWGELATEVIRDNQSLSTVPHAAVRGGIKTKCLALLNGGFLATDAHVGNVFKKFNDSNGRPCTEFTEVATKILAEHPATAEFRDHALSICQKGKIFTLVSDYGFKPEESLGIKDNRMTRSAESDVQKLNCKVYTSVEAVTMSYLAEFASTWKRPLIMLANIHDGGIFATLGTFSQEEIEKFNAAFEQLIEEKLFLRLPAEWKLINPSD